MQTPRSTLSIRVLCVDDSADMTAVMRMMMESEPGMECVGCLASADDLIVEVRRVSPPPNVVILDAVMPGRNPMEAMAALAAAFPAIRIIILSGHDDADFVERAIHAGAWGCISKRAHPDAILQAVREAASERTRPQARAR